MNKPSAIVAAIFAAITSASVSATPTVTIDSVTQRWPWNNKVDIKYTISGGFDLGAATRGGTYHKIKFRASIGGTEYVIDGSKDIIAKAVDGTHTATWTLPDGLKATGCTMVADIYETTGDYMIVDLDSGNFAFEDMEAGATAALCQTNSNTRYNTALYKSTNTVGECRMVLRRIPKAADGANPAFPNGYPTGDDANYGASSSTSYKNSARYWQTDRDYFAGVFMVTQFQYAKLGLTNPSKFNTEKVDNPSQSSTSFNPPEQRPVDNVTWKALRADKNGQASLSSDAASTSFLERLIAKTGLAGFDLPTEIMSEIARRAGISNTKYNYGDNLNHCKYYWATQNGGNAGVGLPCTLPVGSRRPNGFGLYDTTGNAFEWCRGNSGSDLANETDPWTVSVSTPSSGNVARMGGGSATSTVSGSYTTYFNCSRRFYVNGTQGNSASDNSQPVGFRVFWTYTGE